MADIDKALAASRDAVEQLIAAGERAGASWPTPRAPGKWSPSQIVEHVARSLEESANMAGGRPCKFPKLPSLIHPLLRRFLFTRVLEKGVFPKGRTNKAMNPVAGPPTSAEGRVRLQDAHRRFEEACRQVDSRNECLHSSIFGAVTVRDYVRFMELHTTHHRRQIPS